ncbi:hypothetical protein [Nocardia sp. NBC_01009]|uniref:hypothetical protein n=1 Tax=Nocardia sp. NBC_01009 TaxID=2975996 RepID=UPI003869F1AA|nr:hypothetical protein OHA42_34205 [Nocardia sp. NBC_01009]
MRVGVLACLVVSLVAGCSGDTSSHLSIVADCGKLVFPDDVELVWYHREVMFGDQMTDAVVDIPAGEVEEFKKRSGMDKFDAGVPPGWREAWEDSGQAQLLMENAGNEHLVELNKSPTRWVVIHTGGNESRRVFIRSGC